jgi:ParB family chromosome partitioning protein
LGALIPDSGDGDGEAAFRELPVLSIEPNQYQPRERFGDEALEALVESVRDLGVLQPVLVRRTGPATYELIAGERRWRAAKRLGLETIPAVVRDVENQASLEQALVENLVREELTPMEEATAYQQLVDDFSLTQEQVAHRVGRSRSAVANTIRLLQLPSTVQRMVNDGVLSAGHARVLLSIDGRSELERVARRTADEGWTVRGLESYLKRDSDNPDGGEDSGGAAAGEKGASGAASGGGRDPRPSPGERPAAVLELESLLGDHLATRVHVELGAQKGKVIIEFADLADLERISRLML